LLTADNSSGIWSPLEIIICNFRLLNVAVQCRCCVLSRCCCSL